MRVRATFTTVVARMTTKYPRLVATSVQAVGTRPAAPHGRHGTDGA